MSSMSMSMTLRQSKIIKTDKYESLLITQSSLKDLLFNNLVKFIEDGEYSFDDLKIKMLEYISLVKEIKQLQTEIEFIDKRLLSLTLNLSDRLETICSSCVICSSSMIIPVKIICFDCPCDISLCLDCVRTYLKLNQAFHTREPVGCLYCRVKNVVPRRAVDTYTINYELIDKMDDEIANFKCENSLDDLIQCSKCSLYLPNIKTLLKHKRGEDVEPCCESIRVCRYCRSFRKYKDMNGEGCKDCVY